MTGGPEMAPRPIVNIGGPRDGPQSPYAWSAPGHLGRSSISVVLSRLLRESPDPIPAGDAREWWRRASERCADLDAPIDRAIVGGFSGDRVAGAFAAGYQAALRALVPSLSGGAIASFCATERGGNHPRHIETRLAPAGARFTLTGSKRWSTMGPLASVLLVVATEGIDEAGRNRLRLVMVDATAPGVTIGSMPPTKFVPEVPHGAIMLQDAALDEAAVLPGDGYARYVRPFRTVEDLHIHGALLGYLISVARRHHWAQDVMERVAASVAATRALALLDPSAPEVHVALAGVLAQDARLISELAPSWSRVDAAERERWDRDSALFGSVAGEIRERRRQRAWESLTPSGGRR